MFVTVLGASGNVGSRLLREALSRRHEVTAVARSANGFDALPDGVNVRAGDVGNPAAVAELIKGQDVVVSAIRPPEGHEDLLAPLTGAVLDGAGKAGVRAVIVGGAATLKVPFQNGATVLESPGFLPEHVLAIARACKAQYELCLSHGNRNWVYVSPPAMLRPGTRTGGYRSGRDILLVDAEGKSAISMEDFAVAILDEVESPRHDHERFTVAY